MRFKVPLFLCGLLGVAALLIYILLRSATLPNSINNGFSRNYIKDIIGPSKTIKLGDGVTLISGWDNDRIYVSGDDPSWVICLNKELEPIDTLMFGIQRTEDLRSPRIFIDSGLVFMYATELPMLIKGRTGTVEVDTLRLKTNLITRTAQVSSSLLAIRGLDSTKVRQTFKIMDAINGAVRYENKLFENQQFGGFEYDGYLKYDKTLGRLFYVPTFQNGIYCLDTNLNKIYYEHTIDTNYTNRVSVGVRNEGGETKLMATAPREIINKFMDAQNGRVYIMSGLKSDNETLTEFNRVLPIDVYDGKSGKYYGSYALKRLESRKPLDIRVWKGNIVCIYEKGLVALYKM